MEGARGPPDNSGAGTEGWLHTLQPPDPSAEIPAGGLASLYHLFPRTGRDDVAGAGLAMCWAGPCCLVKVDAPMDIQDAAAHGRDFREARRSLAEAGPNERRCSVRRGRDGTGRVV
jgi:hypothetical protein